MIVRLLIPLSVVASTSACAVIPGVGTHSEALACASEATDGLRIVEVETGIDQLGIEIDSTVAVGGLTLVNTQIASGPCKDDLRGFVLDNFYLSDGRVLTKSSSGRLVPRSGAAINDRIMSADGRHPRLGNARFVMGFQVGARRNPTGLIKDYVGLWQRGGRSVVGAFSALPAGDFTGPRQVLISRLPLRSLTYFPAPDSPSGRLGLIQEGPSGQTRLISFDWSHPNSFN